MPNLSTESFTTLDLHLAVHTGLERSNSVIDNLRSDLVNFFKWKWGYEEYDVVTKNEKRGFSQRINTFIQKSLPDNNWQLIRNRIERMGKKGGKCYIYVDFYQTAVGNLLPQEVLATDGAFNCITIAIKSNTLAGESCVGLSHQHFIWNRLNPNIPQFLDEYQKSFKDSLFIINFDDREESEIIELLTNLKERGIQAIAIKRGNGSKESYAEMLVERTGIVIQSGIRLDNNTSKQITLTWDQIERIFDQTSQKNMVLSQDSLKQLLRN
jgi:hypothetical protein